MSTDTIWQTFSTSSADTENLASKIGRVLRGGEVIQLVSDLGGGKTTFVRGLVRGLDSKDHVASPTFTISREYNTGKLKVKHFDFYRLNQAGIIEHELAESLNEPGTVVVIEWSDVIKHILPDNRLSVTIKPISETARQIDFKCPKVLNYLIKDIK